MEVAKRTDKHPRIKIEVLDYSEYVMYEITDDIVENSDQISSTYGQGVQNKCSFSVIDTDGKYVPNENSPFWYGRKIKLYKGLNDVAKGDIYWFAKGVYFIQSVSTERNIVNVSCVDKFGLLTSESGASAFHTSAKIEAGTSMYDCFCDLLLTDTGNGYPIDPVQPLIDADVRKLTNGQDIDISSGGYLGDAIISMANSTRCHIYYDDNGHLRVSKGDTDAFFEGKAATWTFDDKSTAEFLSASCDYDFSTVMNIVTVWGEDFDGTLYRFTAKNNNPKSPTCIARVGNRVGQTKENMTGYDQQTVKDFAEFYLEMKTIQGIGVSLNTILLPHINAGDVVAVTDSYHGFDVKRFLVSEYTIDGAHMTLKLVNVDSLPWHEELSS